MLRTNRSLFAASADSIEGGDATEAAADSKKGTKVTEDAADKSQGSEVAGKEAELQEEQYEGKQGTSSFIGHEESPRGEQEDKEGPQNGASDVRQKQDDGQLEQAVFIGRRTGDRRVDGVGGAGMQGDGPK